MDDDQDAGASCSHLETCELFPRFQSQGPLKIWLLFYCRGDFKRCARYRCSLEAKPVPPNLLPNGKSVDVHLLGGDP